MGASTLPLLMALKRRGYIPNGSAVIEIGAQQLDESFVGATEDIAATGRVFGVATPPPSFARTGPRSDTNALAGAPLAREFWTWLGLSYASIDIDGSPGSIPLDLNYDEVPAELMGRYDVVTNFGTTEHVANQLQSFKIIHDLAAAGALMLHVLPAGGMPNHGLFSYNPKFFWMLGRSNGFAWLAMEPVTGRTHQLRVHAASQGWPIVGDNIYGNGPRFGEPRLHLHSREIGIPISKNKDPVRVVAPAPAHLRERLRACGWNEP